MSQFEKYKIALVHEVSPNDPVSEDEFEIIWKNNPNTKRNIFGVGEFSEWTQ